MLNIILLGLTAIFCAFFPLSVQAESAALSAQSGMDKTLAEDDKSQTSPQGRKVQKKAPMSPEETVDSLAAQSSNWQEPSIHSEERYKKAILQWLDDMQPGQREQAHKILKDAHSEMHALRSAIRDKKKELANMSFNRHTTPEALPRLGQELQNLRKQLRSRLEIVSRRLRQEAGVSMGPLEGDAFWLLPQDIEQGKPNASNMGKGGSSKNAKNSLISHVSIK